MNNDIGVLQNKNTPPPRHTNKTTHTYLLPTKRKTLASRRLTDDEENSLIDTQRISIFHQKGILLVITISARIKKPQHLRHTHTHTQLHKLYVSMEPKETTAHHHCPQLVLGFLSNSYQNFFVIFNRRLWNPSVFHCSLECDTEKTHKFFSIILFTEQVRCLSRLRAQIRTSDLRVNFVDNISASDFNSI